MYEVKATIKEDLFLSQSIPYFLYKSRRSLSPEPETERKSKEEIYVVFAVTDMTNYHYYYTRVCTQASKKMADHHHHHSKESSNSHHRMIEEREK